MQVYLASTSPRRRELLLRAGIAFTPVEPGPEPRGSGLPAERALLRACSKCAGADLRSLPAGIVLGVDTVVDLDGVEQDKPRDRADARGMLLRLAGREHAVHTAHCSRLHPGPVHAIRARVTTARVRVHAVSASEVDAYLDSGEWEGKAGAYGIQGLAGNFCTLLSGDLDTVIGLSVAAVRELLQTTAAR